MKTSTINKIVSTILLAGVCEIGLVGVPAMINLTRASDNPKVIEITAKKFEFTPNEITLKKGEPVILRLTSYRSRARLHVEAAQIRHRYPAPARPPMSPSRPTPPATSPIICDHYCGTGHGGMKMKVTVVE